MGEEGKERRLRILLIRPPFFEIEGSRGHSMDIPLGLLYIAAVLEKENYQVEICDGRVQGKDIFSRKTFSNGYLLGSSWEEMAGFVKSSSPHIVGISNQFTTQFYTTLKMAEVVKKVDPRIVTVVGGPHASITPESFFKRSQFIDIAVMEEGEYVVPEIAEWYQGRRSLDSIKGIVYRNGGRVFQNKPRELIENLDDLPFPAYHLIDLERYFELKAKTKDLDISRPRYNYPGSERSLSFITSRGCPFNCVFCSIHLHMGRKWRANSPQYVLDHLEYLLKTYNVKHVHFEDDNLTLRRKRFEKILDGIGERGLNFTWDTPNGIRADTLDGKLLVKCKQTGCVYLIMGVESGDQYVLDHIIKKKLSLAKVVKICKTAEEVDIDMRSFYVIGFPGETRRHMKKTVDFALYMQRKFKVWPNLMVATPLIGTALFRECTENGYLAKSVDPISLALSTSGVGMIETEDFDIDDVARLKGYFNRRYRKIHYTNFVKGLFHSPKLIIYILLNSFKDLRRTKEYCADTVLFHHYLRNHFLLSVK